MEQIFKIAKVIMSLGLLRGFMTTDSLGGA